MNEIIALQKYENEAQLAKELIRGFWLAHGDYVITDEEAAENLAAWTDKGHVFYFILKEEIPIGFVHLGSRGAEVDWIEDLFVLPEYQGNGYGSHAIALVEVEIKKYSESVYLEVAARNFGAMKLYHRLGYHCLNTVTLRKDFQPENFEVIRSEELLGYPLEVKKYIKQNLTPICAANPDLPTARLNVSPEVRLCRLGLCPRAQSQAAQVHFRVSVF